MTQTLFPSPAPILVPTTEGSAFPVRRIFCIGKNYADHVREMGWDPDTSEPVVFTKPADSVIVPAGGEVPYPPATDDLHYEGEIVAALHSGGRDIAPGDAAGLLYGFALGCDLTRRDIQNASKKGGGPWDMAKGFDHAAVMGSITPMGELVDDTVLALSVNGEERQSATVRHMIYPVARILSHLSALVTLRPGDLVYTGTPEGVGPLVRGDRVEITATGLAPLTFTMA